jgi:hypothetical protein
MIRNYATFLKRKQQAERAMGQHLLALIEGGGMSLEHVIRLAAEDGMIRECGRDIWSLLFASGASHRRRMKAVRALREAGVSLRGTATQAA